MEEAIAAGLRIDPEKRRRLLDEAAREEPRPLMLHNSLKWYWWPAEIVPKPHYDWTRERWSRRMNLARRRTIPDGSLVHDSALELGPDYLKRITAKVTFVER